MIILLYRLRQKKALEKQIRSNFSRFCRTLSSSPSQSQLSFSIALSEDDLGKLKKLFSLEDIKVLCDQMTKIIDYNLMSGSHLNSRESIQHVLLECESKIQNALRQSCAETKSKCETIDNNQKLEKNDFISEKKEIKEKSSAISNSSEFREDEIQILVKSLVRFPVGTISRWEKITDAVNVFNSRNGFPHLKRTEKDIITKTKNFDLIHMKGNEDAFQKHILKMKRDLKDLATVSSSSSSLLDKKVAVNSSSFAATRPISSSTSSSADIELIRQRALDQQHEREQAAKKRSRLGEQPTQASNSDKNDEEKKSEDKEEAVEAVWTADEQLRLEK